jgi:cobalt-zinc-cadmium efflux system protein
LTVALVLVAGLMAGEITAGLIAGSLALLADAGHMLTDAAALAFALFAAAMAARPAAGRWTFGYSRLEILAAQTNGITLGLIAIWIVWTAVHRLIDPHEVRGGIVVAVALVGAAVSLVASFVLARASRESLNVRGAFLHIATDVAAFGAAALAGGLILATGWNRFDPIASLLVAGLMLWSSAQLLRESTVIFLERAPSDADPEAIGRALVAEQDVVEVHDLHVWTVTSGFPALSAHVLVSPEADCHAARARPRTASTSPTRRCRSSTPSRRASSSATQWRAVAPSNAVSLPRCPAWKASRRSSPARRAGSVRPRPTRSRRPAPAWSAALAGLTASRHPSPRSSWT